QLANVDRADKKSLQNRIRNLYLIGKISDAEYKQLSSYVSGNRQTTQADKRRQKEIQANIKLAQDFKRQIEVVGLAVGEFLLPPLREVGGFLSSLKDETGDWGSNLVKVGMVLAGIKVTAFALSPLLGAGKMLKGAIGKASAGAGAAGVGVGGKMGGGLLGSITGSMGTPVRVTNFAEMH
ncbi:unnamed protein product, partial [marine sediment metagenome]